MSSLGEIIEILKYKLSEKPNMIVKIGFHNPHSYRGYYEDLAFEPKLNVSLKEMLEAAQGALGTQYPGWKGGEYTMKDYSTVWISEEGRADGQSVSKILLSYMLEDLFIAMVGE